jgi:hypothetical protein
VSTSSVVRGKNFRNSADIKLEELGNKKPEPQVASGIGIQWVSLFHHSPGENRDGFRVD